MKQKQQKQQQQAPLPTIITAGAASNQEASAGSFSAARFADEAAKTGMPQLAREVRHLYGLLQQAKADRLAQGRRIVELEGMLARERAAKEEVIEKAASDRAAYREMLKQERGLIARTYEKYQDS